ncbi:SRPBCC family protein [Mycobacterium ostraviense]|uniref:SRPBCC family protein n=1 Tax=Mycobacterium ostraviense TaxID=2738409 RepID=UPI000AA988D2|nr:SRPBCC family protein [Mycobacterium ostraviense]UGT91473.1 SRPBCC family protein [Mycobacterium ostraviense]
MRYMGEESVHALAARVWELLVDVEGWPAWMKSMREIERLETGPSTVGSQSRVSQPKGRLMVWTVTELQPMRTFTWVATQPEPSHVFRSRRCVASTTTGAACAPRSS